MTRAPRWLVAAGLIAAACSGHKPAGPRDAAPASPRDGASPRGPHTVASCDLRGMLCIEYRGAILRELGEDGVRELCESVRSGYEHLLSGVGGSRDVNLAWAACPTTGRTAVCSTGEGVWYYYEDNDTDGADCTGSFQRLR